MAASSSLNEFISRLAVHFELPRTSHRIIEELIDADSNAESIAEIIADNQFVEHEFLAEVRALASKQAAEELGLQAAVSLYGMSRTRNFVCALQLAKRFGGKPSERVVYALKAEEAAAARGAADTERAFAAGLVFDVVAAATGLREPVEVAFKHGLRTAELGQELLKIRSAAGHSRFLFAACLVHDVGKLVLEALAQPGGYGQFQEKIKKGGVSRFVGHFAERAAFGPPHEFYSSAVVARFAGLRPIERALLFHHEPYLLKASSPDHWMLAALVALATNIANGNKAPVTSELSGLTLDAKKLARLVESAQPAART